MSEDQEFIFRNDAQTKSNYSKLYKKFHHYYSEEKFTDVTITSSVDQREFKCHRLILAAACVYFDGMFTGNWLEKHKETITIRDFDGDSLELFLQYAYQGWIILNDANIYRVLRFSDIFGMTTMEDLCVRYLTECNVPSDYAIELFVLAYRTNKTSLIPLLSDFILNHLQKLCQEAGENVLLRTNLDDLKAMLTNRKPISLAREEVLWKVLAHWTSENHSEERTVLDELVAICKFHFFHPPPDIAEGDGIESIASGPVGSTSNELLHMYVRDEGERRNLHLLTMDAFDDDKIDFRQLIELTLSAKSEIKTVTIGNHVYLYALEPGRRYYELTFSVYSSVELTGKQSLNTPGNLECFYRIRGTAAAKREFMSLANISADPIHRQIYLHHRFNPPMTNALFQYDCGSDSWSPITYEESEMNLEIMTYFDHRLYTVRKNRILQAYDPRAGRWETLRSSQLPHCHADKCCGHKGKLYATCERENVNRHVRTEAYDPVAGRWREVSPTVSPGEEIPTAGWLVSLENMLWLFENNRFVIHFDFANGFDYHRFRRFNSLIEKWDRGHRVVGDYGYKSIVKDVLVSRSE